MNVEFMLCHDCYGNRYWFAQVLKRTAKTITLRDVRSREGKPVKGGFVEGMNAVTKKVREDGSVSLGSWSGAKPWDGVALHTVHPVFGVNYNVF